MIHRTLTGPNPANLTANSQAIPDSSNQSTTLFTDLKNLTRRGQAIMPATKFLALYQQLTPDEQHNLIATYTNLAATTISAMLYLGRIYGYHQQYNSQQICLTKAADLGSITADYELAWFYLENNTAQDLELAFHYCQKAAQAGYPPAMYLLSCCYHEGFGVKTNRKLANKWLQQVANLDYKEAYNAYNLKLAQIQLIAKQKKKARSAENWFKRTYKSVTAYCNYHVACSFIGGNPFITPNRQRANAHLLRAAELGSADAYHTLAYLLMRNQDNIYDPEQAIVYFEKAEALGSITAKVNLGRIFMEGLGTAKDIKKGRAYLLEAANRGNAEASFFLGWYYMNGDGVIQDKARGLKFYKQAAKRGNVAAMYQIGFYYHHLNGADHKTLTQAAYWLQQAARRGNVPAKYILGVYYHSGIALTKDRPRAQQLFLEVATSYNQTQNGDDLKELLTGVTTTIRTAIISSFAVPFHKLPPTLAANFPIDLISLQPFNKTDMVVILIHKENGLPNCITTLENYLLFINTWPYNIINPISREAPIFKTFLSK